MNRKGFTLIEIMVVLVILVSLTIGGIFGINQIQDKSKDKALKELYTKVETAADVYLSMNEGYAIDLLNGKADEKCLKLYTLQNEGLLSRDLVNPYTNERLDSDSCVMSFLNDKGELENNYELNNKGETHRIDIEVVGGTSSEKYKYGYTKVTFSVDYEENKEIKSVTCDGGANSTFSNKVVVINKINKDQKCTVKIDYIYRNVQINTTGGSASPSNSYVINGRNLDVTLTPMTGYNLNDLNYACNNNTEFSLNGNILTIKNITSDKTCNISFKKNTYTVMVNAFGGSISPSSVIAEHGSSKEFTIFPGTGYILSGASTTCTGGTINNNKLTISYITKNETCSVTLQKQKYTIDLTVVNGSGTSSKTVEHGSSTSFTGVSPNSGYSSSNPTVSCTGGTLSGTTLTISNVTSNTSCTVMFIPQVYSITFNNQNAPTAGTTLAYYQYKTTSTINGVTCYYFTDSTLNTCVVGGQYIVIPSKPGYMFEGYFTSTNGTGTQYVSSDGQFINNAYTTVGNKTLYANYSVCPSGYYCSNNVKLICPAGKYSGSGSSSCSTCDNGKYSDSGSSSCFSCPAGYACSSGLKVGCIAGRYATAGSSTCSTCPNGQYSDANSSSCFSCPAGYACSSGVKRTCLSGYYSTGGASSCTKCPAGYACTTTSRTMCSAGYYSKAGATSCSQCASGYTSSAGSSSCTKISSGGGGGGGGGTYYACTMTGNPYCRTCASTSCSDITGNISMQGAGINIGSYSNGWTYITSSSVGISGCYVANVNGRKPYTC